MWKKKKDEWPATNIFIFRLAALNAEKKFQNNISRDYFEVWIITLFFMVEKDCFLHCWTLDICGGEN